MKKSTALIMVAVAAIGILALARVALAQTAYLPWTTAGGHPNPSSTCRVTAVTAATECKAAPAAGLKLYVTDATISNNVGTAQTVKLVTGTGTNCGTNTADLTHAVQFGAAVGNWDHVYETGLAAPAASAICVTPSAATSVSATLVILTGP